MNGDLAAFARDWMVHDPDRSDAGRVGAMLEGADEAGLSAAFGRWLEFGPDGLCGRLGPGSAQVNRAMVRRIAHAVASMLDGRGISGSVVVGRDARDQSASLASEFAGVVVATGRNVVVARTPVPTPVLAFATRALEASIGIMVTGGAFPAGTNGIRVFGSDGIPVDVAIAAAIGADIRIRAESSPPFVDEAHRYARVHRLSTSTVDAYLASVAGLRVARDVGPVRVVHSALHGVTHRMVQRAFELAGLVPPEPVEDQADPDPGFPSVAAPDPASASAWDRVLARAALAGAALAVVNDPVGDRLGAAVPTPGGWRRLTPDEIGALLADHLLRHTAGPDRLVASTVPSSALIGAMAAGHGVGIVPRAEDFVSLSRAVMDRRGDRLLVASDESFGYGFGDRVRVPDGIAAALLLTEAVAALRDAGEDPLGRLDQLALDHGVHVTGRRTVRADDDRGGAGLDQLAQRGTSMGSLDLRTVVPGVAGGPALLEWVGEGARAVAVHPAPGSGIRLHAEVRRDAGHAGRLAPERAAAAVAVDALLTELEAMVTAGSD